MILASLHILDMDACQHVRAVLVMGNGITTPSLLRFRSVAVPGARARFPPMSGGRSARGRVADSGLRRHGRRLEKRQAAS